ncbi:MAG: DNA mismatch repair endonuclease MutL [Holosporales bacterium]|jgi:DNA mismatch repair protein MutL|nr:DNA mismatch repair endonuclease MutL [Holosporales bacterium]
MGKIKLLSDEIINQIAAGEMVEKPASALKEIIENSIDADAGNVDIFLKSGGKEKIVVEDDGVGLSKDDLQMAVKRHATSKLAGTNLFDVRSYGFRGEALPSIASISEFTLESNGFGISIRYSEGAEIFPSTTSRGTRVTVENLFYKLPARLKFLKSDNAELAGCVNVIENFALTRSDVNFKLRSDEKELLLFQDDSLEARIAQVLGEDLFKKAIHFKESGESISVCGYLFHPMDNRHSQSFQRVFVNKRLVRDRTVSLAIKNAYRDLIPLGRFAAAVIFIEIDPFHVDVNVSPTKSEIRFRDEQYVLKFLTEVMKRHLMKFDRVAVDFDVSKIATMSEIKEQTQGRREVPFVNYVRREGTSGTVVNDHVKPIVQDVETPGFFGNPIAQIFDSYIITEVDDGILIVDQHAVHEKIKQNDIMDKLNSDNKQFIMKPEIMSLTNTQLGTAKQIVGYINNCGFNVEIVQSSMLISAIPSIVTVDEAIDFIKDVLDNYEKFEHVEIHDTIKQRIADVACHNSIQFGRRLSFSEMLEMIKQMERTKSVHQCNHHRPSFVKISKNQLKKMFDRN